MKKFFTFIAALLMGTGMYAQVSSERLVVYDKGRKVQGYMAERIDSVVIHKVEGVVNAEMKVLEVTDDNVFFSIARSPQCRIYKFFIAPAVLAKQLDDAQLANYVDSQTSMIYDQDFTRGQIPTLELNAASEYTAVTVGIDQYNSLCGVSRADFTTNKEAVSGNPQVEATAVDVQARSFTVNFKPNTDVGGYSVYAGKKGELQATYDQWGAQFGFTSIHEMIKGWGMEYQGENSFIWNDMEPNTEYEVVIQPWDINGNFADYQIVYVKTLQKGGAGKAMVDIVLGEYKVSDWNGKQLYGQTITFKPNDQTERFRTLVDLKANYDKDPRAYQNDLMSEPPMPDMVGWYRFEIFENEYQINPGVAAVALAAGKNMNAEWGDVTIVEFTPAASYVAPQSTPVPGFHVTSRTIKLPVQTKGKAPVGLKSGKFMLTGK